MKTYPFLEKLLDDFISAVRLSITQKNVLSLQHVQELLVGYEKHTESGEDKILCHFLFPPLFKSFFLLIRNTNLQLERARFYKLTGQADEASFVKFKTDLFHFLLSESIQLKSDLKSLAEKELSEKELENFEEMVSPWKTYKDQFGRILEQNMAIQSAYAGVESSVHAIGDLTNHTASALANIDEKMSAIAEAIDVLKDACSHHEMEIKKLEKLFSGIQNEIFQMNTVRHNLDFEITSTVEKLPEHIALPVKSREGQLVVQDLYLRKTVGQFFQSDILPAVYEMWELNDDALNKLKTVTTHINNRIKIASGGGEIEFDPQYFLSSVERFEKDFISFSAGIIKLKGEVQAQLNDKLTWQNIPNWTNEHGFSLYDMSGSYFDDTPLIRTINNAVKSLTNRVTRYFNLFHEEYNRNASEVLIDILKSLEHDKHSDYNSIFLTKSYAGKSFYVHRPEKEALVKKSIDRWKEDFRGSMLIKGNYYSGKTTFLSALPSTFKDYAFIQIHPKSEVSFNGRKFEAGYNLEDVLNFLKKYSNEEKTVVLIDNLASWQDQENTLLSNIRSLIRFIDYNNSRFFVIAALEHVQFNAFNKALEIESAFNSVLDLSKIGLKEMVSIISVRHGATHKKLLLKNGNLANENTFKDYVRTIYNDAHGNIGDALRLWALSIKEIDEENVVFEAFKVRDLPDFLDENNSVLLKCICLNYHTNEYQLRKMLGPAFAEKYRDILMRMVNAGVLERDRMGQLAFSENIANQLVNKLQKESYL